ncbi:MAG: phosphoglucomutase/phosphomannomutase family protein [Bacteroidota bacterium]
MKRIKFGTDGWRAIIADDFTVANVARVALATANWLNRRYTRPSVVVGYDCRFGGPLFAETVARVLAFKGVKVYLSEGFVSTPMVSLGLLKLQAQVGVVITASHNPYNYNGFKLKGAHGGPLMPEDIKDIEALIPEELEITLEAIRIDQLVKEGMISYPDLESIYIEHVRSAFDLAAIASSGLKLAFDPMFGSGQKVMKKLLPAVVSINDRHDPFFGYTSPEPLARNLKDFSAYLKNRASFDCGLAVDGDADRIALMDGDGNYIDSHHIILLLIHYLAGYKKLTGKIVTGFSSTVKVEKLAAHYGLPVQRVFIGFKDICKVMLQEDVLVGGEESGGIAVKGHIPERDGIWMGLLIWQFMVETGKSIRELIAEIYAITGSFAFERSDLTLNRDLKSRIVENCRNGSYHSFGPYQVTEQEEFDGYKFHFSDHEWVMIRPSGTEPVLRTYAEAETQEKALDILRCTFETITEA